MSSSRALALAVAVLALLCLHPQANATTIPLTGGGGHTAQACVIAQDGTESRVDAGAAAVTFSGLGTTAGDIQVVTLVSLTNSLTWTKPANFTALDTVTTNSLATFYATTSLVSNPTFTASGGTSSAGIAGSWKNSSGVVDVHSAASPTSTNNGQSTAVTPTTASDAFLAYFLTPGSTAITSTPSGFTEDATTGGFAGSNWGGRDYFLLNPSLTSLQPTLVWGGGVTTLPTSYVVIKPLIAC